MRVPFFRPPPIAPMPPSFPLSFFPPRAGLKTFRFFASPFSPPVRSLFFSEFFSLPLGSALLWAPFFLNVFRFSVHRSFVFLPPPPFKNPPVAPLLSLRRILPNFSLILQPPFPPICRPENTRFKVFTLDLFFSLFAPLPLFFWFFYPLLFGEQGQPGDSPAPPPLFTQESFYPQTPLLRPLDTTHPTRISSGTITF